MAKEKKTADKGLMLMGVLAGAAIGAAVSLVYTPADGEKNRKRLQEWVQSRLNQGQEWAGSRLGQH